MSTTGKSIVAILAAMVALTTFTTVPATAAAKPHRPCTKTHKVSCVYDAKHRGDHRGRSYWVDRKGKRHYISHRVAHQLLAKPKPTPKPTAKPTPVVTKPPTRPSSPPAPQPPAFPQDYAAVGDSITFGIGSSDPATKAWPAVLGMRYTGRPGGALTVDSPWWLSLEHTIMQDLADLHPKVLIVEIGTNDMQFEPGYDRMVTGYQSLQSAGRAAGVRVVLTTIPPKVDFATEVAALNAWIRTQDHVDLDPCIGDGAPEPHLMPEYDSGDYLHLSNAGYAEIAVCVEDALG